MAFIGHLCLSFLVVFGVYLMELLFRLMWGPVEPMVFDRVPLKYLFHAIDVLVIGVFGFWGIVEAHKKLRE